MIRLPAALVASTFLLSAAAAGDPKDTPKEKEPRYFPTAIGAKWVYSAGTASEYTEVVTAVEQKDGVAVVSVGREAGGRVTPTAKYSVSPKGVFVESAGLEQAAAPRCVFKLPHHPGDTWSGSPTGGTSAVYTAGEKVEVEVPAGKFQAIRVDVDYSRGGRVTARAAAWYAPGIGPVKTVSRADGGETTWVLKSFTPGKE